MDMQDLSWVVNTVNGAVRPLEARVAALEAKRAVVFEPITRNADQNLKCSTTRIVNDTSIANVRNAELGGHHLDRLMQSDEDAAIQRVREWAATKTTGVIPVRATDAAHVLAAYDRMRARAADAETDAQSARDSQATWEAEAMQYKQERDDARSEAVALRAHLAERDRVAVRLHGQLDEKDEEVAQLRAQLAARTDATPLGWVNVYGDRNVDMYFHFDEKAARDIAARSPKVKRVAVPIYEHPPRPVAPDYHLVGACVVGSNGGVLSTWTYETDQARKEERAAGEAKEFGGTAHRLYRGEPIAEATP